MSQSNEDDDGRAPSGQALAVPATPAGAVDGPTGFDPSRRVRPTIFEKPKPARVILAAECGLSDDEAMAVLRALVRGGYGVAPRNPTNGMLAGYLEATEPPKHHEATITAIGKARVRWQAMLAHGTEMALSWKFMDRQASAIEARRAADSEAGAVADESAVPDRADAQQQDAP